MNFLRAFYLKKISASVFLLLLISVHAIKALHTHELFPASSINIKDKNAATLKAGFSCAICEFQIAKDSDAEVACVHTAAPVSFINTFYNYILPSYNSVPSISSGTDPPLFA